MRSGVFSRKALAVTCGLCLAVAAPAHAQQSLSIAPNGSTEAANLWGSSDNRNFGQTFRAPNAGNLSVSGVEFQLRQIGGTGAATYWAGIWAWDATTRTPNGIQMSQSAPYAASASVDTPSAGTMTTVRLPMTSAAALTPGGQYVLVLRTWSGDGAASFRLLGDSSNPYAEGDNVYSTTFSIADPGYTVNEEFDLSMMIEFALPGPDLANTLLGLQANSSAVRSVLSQRAAATTFALDNDCSVFDTYGLCVSVGFRTSQIGSEYNDNGETAGILSFAYRVTPEFRLGGFIDQSLTSNTPVGVDAKNTQPMLGAFAVYQENANFSGLTVRAAMAYQQGDLRITRPELENTEAGTGTARTTAMSFGAELAYGFPVDSTWVAQPYLGLRRSDSQRRGYTETTSEAVEFPITYNRFGQVVTSATSGLRLRGAITPQFSLTLGAGVEYDLDSKMDRYAGTSAIPDLESFSIPANQQQNELRGVGTAGMRYMIAANQALAVDTSIRQLPYGNDPAISTMLRYSIGF